MAKNITQPTAKSAASFIAALNNPAKEADARKILKMMQDISGHKPVMWGPSIIGFGKYHYKYESGHEGDAPMMGFSPRKQNFSLYVLGDFEKQEWLLSKLGKYKTGKVCLYINSLRDVDEKILQEIFKESWKHTTIRLKNKQIPGC